jgi:outer membrane protein TolC
MFTTYDKLQQLRSLGEINAEVVVRDALAQISATYYELVQQEQLLQVLRENLELSEARVRLSRERFEIGSAARRELLLAQVDVNADSSALLQQEGLLARTRTQLNQFLGRDPATEFTVVQEIDLRPRFSFESLKTQMLAQNPAVIQARQRREVAVLELKEVQATRLPAVGLNLGYNFTRSNSEAGFLLSNQVSGVNYGFSAGINLFDGFNLGRRIQNARVEIETSVIEAQALQLALETSLLDTWLNYDNSLRLLVLERANVEVSRQNLDIARQTYELGELSSIEFREAQTNHLAAENRLITALYRVKLNEIELMRLSGNNLN